MYGVEEKVYHQLVKLTREFQLSGVKAEFEAEGSSFRDLVRLRRLTATAGVKLHVKIGGVEAVRDIKDSVDLGVDGLIAPMTETAFGVRKFIDSYKNIYKDHKIHLAINVETRNAAEEIDSILDMAVGHVDNVTIGRTDLSASYFDPEIVPDSDFILETIEKISAKVVDRGMTCTIGGSISTTTVTKLKGRPELVANVAKLETRKVILPRDAILRNAEALPEALKFEELYILSKKELSDLFIESEISRLMKLARRV